MVNAYWLFSLSRKLSEIKASKGFCSLSAVLENGTVQVVMIFCSLGKTVLRKCWNFSFGQGSFSCAWLTWNPSWNFKPRQRKSIQYCPWHGGSATQWGQKAGSSSFSPWFKDLSLSWDSCHSIHFTWWSTFFYNYKLHKLERPFLALEVENNSVFMKNHLEYVHLSCGYKVNKENKVLLFYHGFPCALAMPTLCICHCKHIFFRDIIVECLHWLYILLRCVWGTGTFARNNKVKNIHQLKWVCIFPGYSFSHGKYFCRLPWKEWSAWSTWRDRNNFLWLSIPKWLNTIFRMRENAHYFIWLIP